MPQATGLDAKNRVGQTAQEHVGVHTGTHHDPCLAWLGWPWVHVGEIPTACCVIALRKRAPVSPGESPTVAPVGKRLQGPTL